MESTPRHILDTVLRTTCARESTHLERLTSGGLNETYRVHMRVGDPVIVRIARRPGPWFTDEAHAMELARKAGVPTPDVLGVEHVEHDGQLLSFSVLSPLPGRPLGELLDTLDTATIQRLVEHAGALLARVHSVETERGVRHDLVGRDPEELERALRAVHDTLGQQATATVERGARMLEDRLAGPQPPMSLGHGDWLPKHFMIHDGAISGIIDWEFAGPASPARDLARWEVSASQPLHDRADWLRRGYEKVTPIDDDLEHWVPAFAIDWALEVLAWRNPASPERFRRCVDVIARHAAE